MTLFGLPSLLDTILPFRYMTIGPWNWHKKREFFLGPVRNKKTSKDHFFNLIYANDMQHITFSLVLNEWQKTHSSSNTLIGVGGLFNSVASSLSSNVPCFPKTLLFLQGRRFCSVVLALTSGDATSVASAWTLLYGPLAGDAFLFYNKTVFAQNVG
jgi:hypothetical protein